MLFIALLWCASADKLISVEHTELDQLSPLCEGPGVGS